MKFYQFHIGDYTSGTAHLSDDEDLAYRRLIDLYYDTEGPLPDKIEWLCRRIRMAEKGQAVKNVLDEFFTLENGSHHHHRCQSQIDAYQSMRTAGKMGADKRWNNKGLDSPPIAPLSSPHADPNANHKPITNNQNVAPPYPPTGGGSRQKQEEIRVFSDADCKAAKKGDPAWVPTLTDGDVLPGGWHDEASKFTTDDERIYRSWKKFKDKAKSPYQFSRWQGWIKNEN
jgi:uncharacterized protein YdaU (DUF1376 family)